MTRFARSNQNKGRKLDDATPWKKLKPQQSAANKNRKYYIARKNSASNTANNINLHKVDKKLTNRKKVCFKCRQPGHRLADCTAEVGEGNEKICFKCGSTQHSLYQCPKYNQSRLDDSLPYAKCFICKGTGHLSKSCPDNPRGLYPFGGSCKLCGSVEHFHRNCPTRHKEEVNDLKLPILNATASADDDYLVRASNKYINGSTSKTKEKSRIVRF